MKNTRNLYSLSAIGCATLFATSAYAETYLVKTIADYEHVAKQLVAGDEVVLANGRWENFEIVLRGQGTKDEPITLRAQTKGKVLITGQSNLRMAGEYLVVKGLVFTQGYTPSPEVISFRINQQQLANNSRVTETVIDEFSNPDRFESDYWVALYGKNNRFDHNYLAGKRNRGVTLAVRLDSEESRENNHLIDHNYFGYRPVFGSNGGETLRVGTSHFSMFDSLTTIDSNYFENCDGEVEIISIKSGKNRITNNVFDRSKGTLTLRHGNGNQVESNVFFGHGVEHTGGIRIINQDQVVKNNYLEGLTGYRFGAGFTVMNGVPNSPVNRYMPVKNAQIENNTFVDLDFIEIGAGADAERSQAPSDSTFANNFIYNQSAKNLVTVHSDASGIEFINNPAVNVTSRAVPLNNMAKDKVTVKRADNGLIYPQKLSDVGVERQLQVLNKADVGPSWYGKKSAFTKFDSGKVVQVKAGENTLFDAIAAAKDGDILELSAGNYPSPKIIFLDKTITVKAKKGADVTILPMRSTFLEIQNNGSLKMIGVTIAGDAAPDYKGNTIFRTLKSGMYKNFRLVLDQMVVRDLDINGFYNIFDAGYRSLADTVSITNSEFKNITGDVLRLNKETDDLGVFNADHVVLLNNTFSNIQGTLVRLYRGGRDESTFGPHLNMQNNQVINVGTGKNNKGGLALELLGVQEMHIKNNQFKQSASVQLVTQVGEPKVSIENNQLVGTAKFDISVTPSK
ncbi:Poly(beta-D-mannuronate) lyase [Catenovulum agarivorans DS-2]|uniref:Poly(Beta-D-mannuronate) lyase n=1 Tax=Catenovulum agarivorans DS-2 TaxID=1328313 RepID=W7QRA6_9ALTE|nr:chondroitinase-B domain-containing protein [Catenovulum agarivorans]EWH11527.1 Poly(beta-D-mannuronate) lyase [Catenovulum agarivorans DS-2]